jgi:uncharacterized protein DUF4382
MNRSKTLSLLLILLLTVLSLAACSGPKNGCISNCGGTGNATVSLTLVSDTPPASPSLLSYKVTVLSVTLTPATGTAFTFTPSPAPVIELMRLQSDTAFLGTLLNVPVGTYTSITVSLGSPQITFLNNTTATITNASSASGSCTVNAICTMSPNAAGLPKITTAPFPVTLSGGAKIGLGIDFNLSNSITVTGGTMTVTFTPATAGVNVLSAFNLPRTNANLGTNELELIEDFTGVVSINGSTVTITSSTRGVLASTSTSMSFFDPSPDGATCPATSNISCVKAGQIASVDAFLNTDGTFSLKEFEPLNATQQDFVEGIVVTINPSNQTQFTIVTTDELKAATNSVIGVLKVGDLLTVNLVNAKPFLVDTKGLPVSQNFTGIFNNFANATTTGAIHPGQTVAVHLTSFTAATASASATSNADTVTLRWSRLTGTPTSQPGPTFNFINIPAYFNLPSASSFEVQTFLGTAGADGVTNLEGITNVNAIDDTKPVALRALYLQNTANSAAPVFFAAKVRQH